jgi:hypothetical protein
MERKSRIAVLLVAAGAATFSLRASPVSAGEYNSHAQSGEARRIWMFYGCRHHAPSAPAFVDHGSVTYKDGVQNRCGNANEPVWEAWYTSAPGFKGLDKVTIPWGKRGHRPTIIDVAVQ